MICGGFTAVGVGKGDDKIGGGVKVATRRRGTLAITMLGSGSGKAATSIRVSSAKSRGSKSLRDMGESSKFDWDQSEVLCS